MVVVWQSRIDGERYKEMVSCEREEKQRQKMERLRVCCIWREEKKERERSMGKITAFSFFRVFN